MCEKSLSPIKRISSSKSPTMNSKSGHNYYKIQYSKCSYALYIIIVLCLIHPTLQQNTNIRKTKQ